MSASLVNISLQQKQDYQFEVSFGGSVPPLLADEPAPMGSGLRPSPVQLLAAAGHRPLGQFSVGVNTAGKEALVRLNSNQNTLPTPTVLSAPMVPPISSISRFVTTRPMPVPSSEPLSLPRRLNG